MHLRLRLFGHPIHIQAVNFPLALLFLVVPLDILSGIAHDPFWSRMAGWCLVGGIVSGVGAAGSGLLDYMLLPPGHQAMGMATRHLYAQATGIAAFVVSLIIRGGISLPDAPARAVAAAAFAVVGMVAVSWGAWMGGELTLRYGVGSRAQEPAMSGNGHAAKKRAEEVVQRPPAGVTR